MKGIDVTCVDRGVRPVEIRPDTALTCVGMTGGGDRPVGTSEDHTMENGVPYTLAEVRTDEEVLVLRLYLNQEVTADVTRIVRCGRFSPIPSDTLDIQRVVVYL